MELAIKNLETTEKRADIGVKNIEKQLSDATKIVNNWVNKVKEENEKQIEAKRIEVEKKFQKVVSDFDDFKKRQIAEFEIVDKRRTQFMEMYEIGVKYSKDARFDDYSNNEKTVADRYRLLSLILMILVVTSVGLMTFYSQSESQQWHLIVSRFLLVFSLMIPAIYASRESNRHRRNSDKYAQMANELKAFEIAMGTEDMPSDTKNRIKEEIFKRFFGNIFANSMAERNIGDDLLDMSKMFKNEGKEPTS